MEADTGAVLATVTSPDKELEIIAEKPGFAEQHPCVWWENLISATLKIKAELGFNASDVKAIGISESGIRHADKSRRSVLYPLDP